MTQLNLATKHWLYGFGVEESAQYAKFEVEAIVCLRGIRWLLVLIVESFNLLTDIEEMEVDGVRLPL